jgi:hypothetical protein
MDFSDGVSIDTGGEYRAICCTDGWYFVGKGILIPCRDEAEATEIMHEFADNPSVSILHGEKTHVDNGPVRFTYWRHAPLDTSGEESFDE